MVLRNKIRGILLKNLAYKNPTRVFKENKKQSPTNKKQYKQRSKPEPHAHAN
jgi:hypothetical protein